MEYAVSVESFLSSLQRHNPHQPEYLQAVREVFTSLWPFIERNPRYREQALLERPVEPERVIQFRVSWVDDRGGAGQPRLPRAVQLGHRPLQGRHALPPVGKPVDPEVPRF